MRVLRGPDFKTMPWANGRGVTVELLRIDGPDGRMRFRLSRASVVEDGPFSLFPQVERVLTVISGPGFDLTGARQLRCDPLVPVGFPGNVPVSACGVSEPCEDFNVMWARGMLPPKVIVLRGGGSLECRTVCLFALGDVTVNGVALRWGEVAVVEGAAQIAGSVIAVSVGFDLRDGGVKPHPTPAP